MSRRLESKESLREELRKRLRTVSESNHQQLQQHLQTFLQTQNGIWGAYSALPGEPRLTELIQGLNSIRWAFPRIEDQQLAFHVPKAPADWESGPLGTRQPKIETERVKPEDLSGLLIPGLGFDRQGHRLGRGKGYYDRALSKVRGRRVGVCFECQWLSQIPVEAHDQRVQVIVTESGLHRLEEE